MRHVTLASLLTLGRVALTNLIDNTESSSRRLFEPVALVLLAAGGVTAAIARSDSASEQPGLVMPPLTAQAHAEGSPPPADPATPAAAEPTDPKTAPAPLPVPVALTTRAAAPQPAAAVDNRFAETFAEVGAAPASLALEQPAPLAMATLEPAKAEVASTAAIVVPEAAAPAMQLVAIDPAQSIAPSPAVELPASAAPIQLAIASPVPELAPIAAPVAPAQIAIAPAVVAVEAVAITAVEVPVVAPPPAVSPAASEPAELVPQAAPAPVAESPVALAVIAAEPEQPKVAFVSEPMVQPVPAGPAAKPLATPPERPAASTAQLALKAAPAARPGKAKAKAPRGTQIGGTIPSNFQLTDGTIDYRIGVRVNGGDPASLPMRITRDDQLSVKLGDLLSVVKPQMDPALYAYLSSSRGADEYVSFAAIRAVGIDIRYDAARDQLLLGVE